MLKEECMKQAVYSKYFCPGMVFGKLNAFEDGIRAALDWLLGRRDESPADE
jgi:hypothetical protein